MKVVLAGASGSGKTTLAKAIGEALNLSFNENSAGLIISAQDKEYMKRQFGYEGNAGQRGVINKSHTNPQFGLYFQHAILEARKKLFSAKDNMVLDRSPLDPIVFYLNQLVHNFSQQETDFFVEMCLDAIIEARITHIIYTPLQNPKREIEDNDSRVANYYFQKKIDMLFGYVLELLKRRCIQMHVECPKIHQTPCWDWDKRLSDSLYFLSK